MKKCSKCKESKLIVEFSKDKYRKDGLKNQCKSCRKAHYQDNKEQVLAQHKEYYQANREKKLERQKVYKQVNRERIQVNSREFYKTNREQILEQQKAYYLTNQEQIKTYQRKYSQANPDKINAKNAKRRATKLQATPKWLTKEEHRWMELFYLIVKVGKEQGQQFEVDHIVPLQGENVCGLHVPWNLQVIRKTANRIKSNKLGAT